MRKNLSRNIVGVCNEASFAREYLLADVNKPLNKLEKATVLIIHQEFLRLWRDSVDRVANDAKRLSRADASAAATFSGKANRNVP